MAVAEVVRVPGILTQLFQLAITLAVLEQQRLLPAELAEGFYVPPAEPLVELV